jgi:restriction endonuclease S subunit
MGGTPRTKVREYWEPPEIVWVTPEDMERQELNRITSSRRHISVVGLEKSSAKLFPAGAVLLSTTATIGKVGIAEIPLSANQQISGIICSEKINREFIAYYLLSVGEDGLRKFGGTATATHINQTNLRSLEAVRETIRALKEAQAATEAELKRLEQAILEKAFRGEL